MSVLSPRPIDPLAVTLGAHRYDDDVLSVERGDRVAAGAVRTEHFATWSDGHRLHVAHALPAEAIDNDLAGLISRELFDPGWLTGNDVFERVFTGIVLSSAADAPTAWELFYRNTLKRLAAPDGRGGSLAQYAPVYAQAAELAGTGSVLELGCCFGFLSLQLADQAQVTASDVTPNTVRLLAAVAGQLGRSVHTLICDAARVPRSDRSYDVVLAIHLLEHLEPDHGVAVLAEMLRLARRRVVVAVPFEEEPATEFGHLRVFDLPALQEMGDATGWSATCFEHHGGWLVLDRP